MKSRKIHARLGLITKLVVFALIVLIFLTSIHVCQSLGKRSLSKIRDLTFGPTASSSNSTSSQAPLSRELLWQHLHLLFKNNEPHVSAIIPSSPANKTAFTRHAAIKLPNLIHLAESDKTILRRAHTNVVINITSKTFPALAYNDGTQGIVTTASGRYLLILLTSLRMTRRTGCALPVEVFVESEIDFTSTICRDHLPSLDARCFLFSDIAVSDLSKVNIGSFQYKVFAILFSTFQNILFLDADNFAIRDPSYLFPADPFLSHGLVTWPDFWTSTASPLFSDISSHAQMSPSIRPSTESGQMLVSKKQHAATLLLASYYNFYGPSHYWPLLGQGGPGQGDKETYAAAATALNIPFYQVHEPVKEVGHLRDLSFRGVAMTQHNPVTDQLRQQGSRKPRPEALFVHQHNPKLDPLDIFNEMSPCRDASGRWQRMWGSAAKNRKQFGGLDLERRLWQEFCIVTCTTRSAERGLEKEYEDRCSQCKAYTKTVFGREGGF